MRSLGSRSLDRTQFPAMTLTVEELSSEPYCQGHLFTADVPENHQAGRLEQLNIIDRRLPGLSLPPCTESRLIEW